MNHPPVLITGEALVDFIPDRPRPLQAVEQFSRRVGGAAANVAVTLAKLDYPPLFWTRLGSDPFGDFVTATLADHNVKMKFVERDPDAKTALSFVSHDESAHPEFTIYRDRMADTRLTPGTIDDDVTRQLSWVYTGGVQLSADPTRAATFDLVERINETDADVLFDPNARPSLWNDYDFESTVKEILPFVDVVKTTIADLENTNFPTESPETLATALCERGPHTVFITLEDSGAFARTTSASPFDEGDWNHKGFTVDTVDTTGAGDAFVGGVIMASLEGMTDIEIILKRANAIAALSTTKKGALSALPTRSALAEFLDASDGSDI